MIVLRTVDLRNGFKKVSNLIKAGEKVLVARPHNENLVILGEKEYNELEKARRDAAYLPRVDQSFMQAPESRIGQAVAGEKIWRGDLPVLDNPVYLPGFTMFTKEELNER